MTPSDFLLNAHLFLNFGTVFMLAFFATVVQLS